MSSRPRTHRWPPQPIELRDRGPIARDDLPGLCDRVCALCERGADVALCDVRGVDAGRRHGRRARAAPARRAAARLPVRLRNASPELLELVAFMGLRRRAAGLTSSRGGQAEEREQRLGVEEERELDDPAVRRSRAPAAPTARSRSPVSLGLYWPNAGEPFAATVGITREPRQPMPGPEPPA